MNTIHASHLQQRVLAHPLWGHTGRHGPAVLAVILVIILAWKLSALIWWLVPEPDTPPPPPSEPGLSRSTADGDDVIAVARQAAQARPFGTADRGPAPAESQVEDAPETDLNLALRAVFAAEPMEGSMAIVAVGGGEERAFSVGERVTRGATLVGVYRDRVILERDGRREALRFPESETSGRVQSRPAENRDRLQQLAARLRSDPTQLTDIISPTPEMQDGQMIGFRVNPGRDRAGFARLGLRPNDIVTEVNGVKLDSLAAAESLYEVLSSGRQFTATVIRQGREQQIGIRMEM